MLHAGSAHVYETLYPILFRIAYRIAEIESKPKTSVRKSSSTSSGESPCRSGADQVLADPGSEPGLTMKEAVREARPAGFRAHPAVSESGHGSA
jgi:hypothetical protein